MSIVSRRLHFLWRSFKVKAARQSREKEIFVPIEVGNYTKRILLRWIIEISVILWKIKDNTPARSPNHDHSVSEITLRLWGRIYEIRHGIKRYYRWKFIIWVPKGTIHEVGVDLADGSALTVNICLGLLSMNTYPSTRIE
jgi:hypothetical protein